MTIIQCFVICKHVYSTYIRSSTHTRKCERRRSIDTPGTWPGLYTHSARPRERVWIRRKRIKYKNENICQQGGHTTAILAHTHTHKPNILPDQTELLPTTAAESVFFGNFSAWRPLQYPFHFVGSLCGQRGAGWKRGPQDDVLYYSHV